MSKTPTTQAMPRDDSPRGSPRNSRGSNENDLSFEKYDVDNDRFSTNFGDIESKISADLDAYNELDQNPIFRQLCPKKNYEDKSTCKVCNKSFKFMTKKKSCKFCGASICEEHGKKKRPNPENTVEYVRICDVCDELHIQKTILGEFKTKLDKKLVAIKKYEQEINEQQFRIDDSQKEIDELNLKKQRNDKNYSEQMNFLTNDIAKGKDEVRKCEKDSNEMNKELKNSQKKVEDLDGELVQSEKEYEKLSKEAIELTNQIEALNQDISQTNKTIRNMEEVISAQTKAEKAAAEKAAEKASAEKLAAEKAAEKASAEKLAAERLAERAAAEKLAAERLAEKAAQPVPTSTTTITLKEENIIGSMKDLEFQAKDESLSLSPPSETRESIQRPVEPEELVLEKAEPPKPKTRSSMISTTENTGKKSMAKSSMSQAAPRMVRNSMAQSNKGGNNGKPNNCDVGCSMF